MNSLSIKSPLLSSTTQDKIRKFVKEYDLYVRQVENRKETSGEEITPLSMKSCIETRILKFLINFKIKNTDGTNINDIKDLTEEMVQNYILGM